VVIKFWKLPSRGRGTREGQAEGAEINGGDLITYIGTNRKTDYQLGVYRSRTGGGKKEKGADRANYGLFATRRGGGAMI